MFEPSSGAAEKTSHGTVDIELSKMDGDSKKVAPMSSAAPLSSAQPSSRAGQSAEPTSRKASPAKPATEIHQIGPSSEHPTKSEPEKKKQPSSEVPKNAPSSEVPKRAPSSEAPNRQPLPSSEVPRTELVTTMPQFIRKPPATSTMPTAYNGMVLVPEPIEAYAIKAIARDRRIIKLFWLYASVSIGLGVFLTIFVGAYAGSKCFGKCSGIKT